MYLVESETAIRKSGGKMRRSTWGDKFVTIAFAESLEIDVVSEGKTYKASAFGDLLLVDPKRQVKGEGWVGGNKLGWTPDLEEKQLATDWEVFDVPTTEPVV